MDSNKGKEKKMIDEILGDLSKSSAAKQMLLGTSMGWVTGFMTMKIGKAAAIAAGGSIILLQIAHHKGYLKVNWDKLQKQTDKIMDKIEAEATGQGPSAMDKLERYVDRKVDKMERKARRWYHSFVNNGENGGYQLQELHIFMASFVAGIAFGFASA